MPSLDPLLNFLKKKPVWVTVLVVVVISWFGAPIGFAVITVRYFVPTIQTTIKDQEERHIEERRMDREAWRDHIITLDKNSTARLDLLTDSFEGALTRQEKAADKSIELLERLTTRVEAIRNQPTEN